MNSLGLDIGTTSCKLCVLSPATSSESRRVVFAEQLAHDAHLRRDEHPSFDEQCPSKILQAVDTLLARSDVVSRISSIKSIQVCGQMHGVILWSSHSPRTIVSSLITWQDQRCSPEFLSSLGPSLSHLRTGYGLATLLWLVHHQRENEDPLERYDRAGTIADYIVAILCEDSNPKSQLSNQMSTSWGAVNDAWPSEHRLLPEIVEPGTLVGYWKKTAAIYVALGDLQCSVFSCQPRENQGIVNISTSAQLALVVDRQEIGCKNPTLPSSMRVPYFQSKDLLVAASLNGGNVLSAFVQLIHAWQETLTGTPSSSPIDLLWTRLIELALRSSSPFEHLSAALFGERHDPSISASITNIRSMNIAQLHDIGAVFRSMCRWIVRNLFDMLGDEALRIEELIGTGSALMRNAVLQRELNERVRGQLVFRDDCDAAYGAALFALEQ